MPGGQIAGPDGGPDRARAGLDRAARLRPSAAQAVAEADRVTPVLAAVAVGALAAAVHAEAVGGSREAPGHRVVARDGAGRVVPYGSNYWNLESPDVPALAAGLGRRHLFLKAFQAEPHLGIEGNLAFWPGPLRLRHVLETADQDFFHRHAADAVALFAQRRLDFQNNLRGG